MSVPPPEKPVMDAAEERARARYTFLNMARIGGIAAAIAGIAGTRDVIPLPYAVSVALAVVGILAFFFAPPLMVKRWKARDAEEAGAENAEAGRGGENSP
ncbi:MAG: hypothetical protein AAFY81_06235 [Pseudomonadota bacterium]